MSDRPRSESAVEALYRQARRQIVARETPRSVPAVGAVLWRRTEAGDIEVYMAQRGAQVRFLPGQWSFPGGGVEDEDRHVDIAGAQGDEAMRIAALIREVHEETGLTLPAQARCFVPAAYFTSPEIMPIRFSAWFFLVEVARDVVLDHRRSNGELQDSAWLPPREALERWRQGRWIMPEPVRDILAALSPGIDGAAERCAAAAARSAPSMRVFELAPGIAVAPLRTPTLPPATQTNCYLIGSGDVVVVDPASPYDDERAALDRIVDEWAANGRRVVEIWLTHHHADHVGGAAHLSARLGVPVAAHERTAELVASRVPVDRVLDDGDTLDLDGDPPRRVRAVFTPGHAPGHLCMLEEHTGFVVAGDMVAGVGTIIVEPTEGHMGQYLRSLERMKELEPASLLPAHGPVIVDAMAKLDEYVAHRRWREARIVDALRQRGPARAADLVPVAYSDTPPAVHPLAERSLVAHLIKLEEDGAAARNGDTWRLLAP